MRNQQLQQEPDENHYQQGAILKTLELKCPQHYLTEMQKTAADAKCMTRSLTKELFTPFKDPKQEFQSSRKHFKTISLDESRSPDFHLFSDKEEYSEEEDAETMAKTMEQYMSKTQADYGSRVARPKIEDTDNFELKGQFLKELRTNTFSGASVSVVPLSTYLNLGLGVLDRTKLTVELGDMTVKYPKGIAKNVLVDYFEGWRIKNYFQSVKPASSLIKRVYMLSLRERMELDLEARLMGETLVINRSLDPLNEDYIELNDLNKPFELKRNQGDNLMPTIKEREVLEEFRTRDDELDTGIDDYPSYCDYDKKIHIDCAHNLKFSCMIGFEFTHVNFFPLLYVNVMSKKFHNSITKVSDEDKKNGISHPYQKLKGFYKGVLNLGPDYIRDTKMEEWLTRGHISVHEMEWQCMTRSSTKELFTPFKDPKREFRSSRKHFKTISLDESRSPYFHLFSNKEEYSEEEDAVTMTETMEQYMSKTRADYGSRVARPKIEDKDNFEQKGQFLKELRINTFSGSNHEDANEHIEKVLEIIDLFHIPNITIDQVMLRAFPMSLTGAVSHWLRNEPTGLITTWDGLKTKLLNKYRPPPQTAKKMEEINNFQQEPDENHYQAWERFKELLMKCPQHYLTETQEKWHNGTSRSRSTETSDGLATIQAQLNNLGREFKKVNEKSMLLKLDANNAKDPITPKIAHSKKKGKPSKKLTTHNLVDLFKEQRSARSSTKELFTPFKDPKREFRSSRKHFKTGQFLKELRTNTFSGSDHEDANEHIEKVLESSIQKKKTILFHMSKLLNIDQVMLRAFPMYLTGAIKKVNEKVYAAQAGCEQCKGPHYTKDCPLKEEGKTQFGGPFQGRGYRAAALRFYQRNNANPSYQERRQSMEDNLSKFMSESTKRHEENSNLIKEIQASMDAAIRNQGASIKTLEIQIRKMSKVLQERGFGSLPSSTEAKLRDQVKSISTTIEAESYLIRRASVSVVPLSTYLNLGLGKLARTKLTVELADRTVKYLKGIAKNVLVGIGKFVFPIDFIILDMPDDIKGPLMIGRPFLSTARAKIDVFK
ncbi:DNA-directed DNA polymerase [Tanacetum coccineum]|uniref:DNA-directed DNA polymerase n=1 Tax=Tanacetum coccineum TaxID=301880 RepID=A0ABQ5GRN5_9ASTR